MFQIETWFQQNKTICYIKLNINMNSVLLTQIVNINANYENIINYALFI